MNYYLISEDNGCEHLRELQREAELERQASEAIKVREDNQRKSKFQSALLRLLSVVIR
jgi:hypothetical protein